MSTQVSGGIVLVLNGQRIPLRPQQVKDAVANTSVIDVGLPAGMKIDFGPAGSGLNDIVQTISGDATWDYTNEITDLPQEFQDALGRLATATLSIDALHMRLEKNGTTNKKSFTIGMALTWTDPADQPSFAGVSLEGIYLNITNE